MFNICLIVLAILIFASIPLAKITVTDFYKMVLEVLKNW
jgi:hypothetical protein